MNNHHTSTLDAGQQSPRNLQPYERGEFSSLELTAALRQRWGLVVLLALLGGVLGFGASFLLGTSYTSTASGVVVATGGQDATEALAGENLAQSKALTFGSLAGNTTTAATVIDELDLDITPEALVQHVKTTVPVDTSEVRVAATASSPQEAQKLANAWLDALGKEVDNLGSNAKGDVTVKLTKVGSASLPHDPSSTSPAVLVAVGILLGLIVGVLVAVMRHRTSRSN